MSCRFELLWNFTHTHPVAPWKARRQQQQQLQKLWRKKHNKQLFFQLRQRTAAICFCFFHEESNNVVWLYVKVYVAPWKTSATAAKALEMSPSKKKNIKTAVFQLRQRKAAACCCFSTEASKVCCGYISLRSTVEGVSNSCKSFGDEALGNRFFIADAVTTTISKKCFLSSSHKRYNLTLEIVISEQ